MNFVGFLFFEFVVPIANVPPSFAVTSLVHVCTQLVVLLYIYKFLISFGLGPLLRAGVQSQTSVLLLGRQLRRSEIWLKRFDLFSCELFFSFQVVFLMCSRLLVRVFCFILTFDLHSRSLPAWIFL